jgi:hypothetical protein
MKTPHAAFRRRCRDGLLPGGARLAMPMLLGLAVAVGLAETEPQQVVPARLEAERAKQFEKDVLPLLKNRCVKCHGEKAREGGLRFGRAEDLSHLNDSGMAAIDPGGSAKSELIARVTSQDEDLQMPPKGEGKRLTKEEVATLRRWIDDGAVWPEHLTSKAAHWSYRKPVKAALPDVSNLNWVQNPIDRFVLVRLDREGMKPSPKTDRARLIRRVYLDLIGIPPSPKEVDAFLADDSPLAYEKVVDRLLDSPRFGERWARQWLDLARYADSNGFQADQFRSMWAFRDWVIRALNDGMPFDQFTIEQIAGDLIPNATVDQKVATGFHRCPTCNVEAGVDPEENRVNQVIDRINTTGTVWLGTTLECAQCHNHKYDPFTQQDYYQLFAFFNNTPLEVKLTSGVTYDFFGPKFELPLNGLRKSRREALQAKIEAVRKKITERESELATGQAEWKAKLLSSAQTEAQWHVLEVAEFASAGGATFTKLADKSVLVGGPNPATDTYTVTVRTDLTGITGFKIEGLLDDSLPGKGPGRQTQENRANFVLTDLKITACDCEDDSKDTSPLALHTAKGDVEDPSFKAATVLDADPKSGWSIHKWYHEPHHLTVLTSEPTGFDAGTRLVFKLDFQYGLQRSIGRLRLSALTGNPNEKALPPEILASLKKPAKKRSKKETSALATFRTSRDGQSQTLAKEVAALEVELKKIAPESTLVMIEMAKARPTNIMRRGEFLNKGAAVEAATPSILHSLPDGLPRNRLGLAQWLASPENPLVARVAVNRWWSEMFGRGIVATLEDFGTQGERPTHPQLLDWLAVEFVESGWSMKHVLRLMATSATYQQSSRVTPEALERDSLNLLLARASRFRLPAETIRDNALTASGLLAEKMAGPPVYPPQPSNIWRHVGRNAPKYLTSQGVDRYRRGIYTVWRRSAPYPSFVTFDAPDRGSCVVDRSRTNTPLQALNLLNDEAYFEMSLALAERTLRQVPSNDVAARVNFAFRACLSRAPTDRERDFLIEVAREETDHFQANSKQATELTGKWKSAADLDAKELATWFRISEVLLNLDEMITRG